MWSHVRQESDDYEERDLGEIAATNQVHQEHRWGPHTALSDAHYNSYHRDPYIQPSAFMPQSPAYELASYGNEIYATAYTPSALYAYCSNPGPLSNSSRNHNDGQTRQSFELADRSSAVRTVMGPASMFDVRAAHHLFGRREHQSGEQDSALHSATQLGDPLPTFPNWSRTWYNGHLSADGHAYTTVVPPSDQSGWQSDSYGRYGPVLARYPTDRMNDSVKEERIRMLEKEFGPQIARRDDDIGDEELEPKAVSVGSIGADGRLILPSRKLCVVTRVFQCLLSLTAAGCGIGGFAFIHPPEKALASGTMPAYALYAVSAISVLACLWLFVLKPCCAGNRRRNALSAIEGGVGGMLVPITGDNSNGKLGKKNKRGQQQQGAVVNVILDPAMFLRDAEGSDSDSDGGVESGPRNSKRKAKRRSRTNMLSKMRAQAQWRVARKALRLECVCDVALCLLWAAAAVFALGFGTSCPAGTAQGWCDLYNGAIACAVLAAVACFVAIYCDAVRLKASRREPL